MASTYSPNDAFDYAESMCSDPRLTDVQYQILDEACSQIWMASPWPWTVGILDPITVAAETVDYALTYPADFGYIYKALLLDGENIFTPLWIDPVLPDDPLLTGQTISVSALPDDDLLRIYPKPPVVGSMPSTTQYIYTFYKKNPPKITAANAGTAGAMVLDDRWFHVYKSAVLINAYKYTDDARGFDIVVDSSKNVKLGGEIANFKMLLDEMRQREPLPYQWQTSSDMKAENV